MHKIPITIGVIGHVDAIITDEHKKKIMAIFEEIITKYPASPIVLFSQLALGADTEVAECFLTFKEKSQRDCRLVVPVPYAIETYKKTQFETIEQLKHFEELISKAERVFELTDDKEEKNDYYRQGGEFVADSAMILIALWDGIDNGKTGGTADTVRYKIEGSYNDKIGKHIFDANGDLISLHCNRTITSEPTESVFDDKPVQKLIERNSGIREALENVEFLNAHMAKKKHQKLMAASRSAYAHNDVLDRNAALLLDYFSAADAQAVHSYKKYSFGLLTLFVIGFIFFAFFDAYKAMGLIPWIFFATAGTLFLSMIFLYVSRKKKYHETYINYRILAEYMRVQFFWNLRKISLAIADSVLRINTIEYNWVMYIGDAIYGYTYPDRMEKKQSIESIKRNWIDDQKQYFQKKITTFEKIKKYFDVSAFIFVGSSILLLVVIFIMKQHDVTEHVIEPLVFVDTLLLALGVFIKAYHEERGYEEIISEYMMMYHIFDICDAKIDMILKSDLTQEEKEAELDELLILTGKESIAENGSWYMVYKEKALEIKGVG